MSEAAAACVVAGGFAIPTIVATRKTGAGGAMSYIGISLTDDYIFHWQTVANLTIPTPVAGYTAFAAGISCDASGNDCSVMLAVKKVAADDEGVPAVSGGSRAISVLVRDLHASYVAALEQAYNNTIGAGLSFSAFTPSRNVPILAFSKITGSAAVSLNNLGLTELTVESSGSAEARAAAIATPVSSFAGGIIGATPIATQARATVVVPLYGKAT